MASSSLDDEIDQLMKVLQYDNCSTALQAAAYSTGLIDPSGSFLHGDGLRARQQGTTVRPLTHEERCRGLVALRNTDGFGIRALPPPPAHLACSVWVGRSHGSLTPDDYTGLGLTRDASGNWRFSVDELRRHCALAPGAVDAALRCAAATPDRCLKCQTLDCSAVPDAETCTVCPLCLMGIYCAACASKMDGKQLCRVCLLFATVKQTPLNWMFRRSQQLRRVLDSGGIKADSADGDCYETVTVLCARHAVRELVRRTACQPSN